jgi:capsid protein
MIQIALKSLDIPHCFYDESESAWSSARSAWIQYENSAKSKRLNLRDLLDKITYWKLASFIAGGLIELPGKMLLRDLQWEWVFTGVPWIDLLKEMQANQLAIALRLRSRTRILRGQQEEFEDIADELAAEEQILEERGLDSSLPGFGSTAANAGNDDEDGDGKKATTKSTKSTKGSRKQSAGQGA